MEAGPGISEKEEYRSWWNSSKTISEKYTIQIKKKANIFNDFFIKQSTLEHEDDTTKPPSTRLST